jgi:hypothetical protein
MVRLQLSTQADNAFTASGVISGRKITVNRIPAVTRQQIIDNRQHLGNLFIQHEGSVFLNIPASTITEPTPVAGSLTPGNFEAIGFGVPVIFQVGIVEHSTTGRTGKLDLTHIEIGSRNEGNEWNLSTPVELDAISSRGLLRMAIQASRCVGMAFPVGWAIDTNGKPLGALQVGDAIPATVAKTWGIEKYERNTKTGVRVVAQLASTCEIELWDAGEVEALNDKHVRHLTGKAPTGRKKQRGSMSDPKILKIVAKLYTEAEKGTDGLRKPEWVRQQLIARHGLTYSESWVRSTGKNARDAGLLKYGRREVTK